MAVDKKKKKDPTAERIKQRKEVMRQVTGSSREAQLQGRAVSSTSAAKPIVIKPPETTLPRRQTMSPRKQKVRTGNYITKTQSGKDTTVSMKGGSITVHGSSKLDMRSNRTPTGGGRHARVGYGGGVMSPVKNTSTSQAYTGYTGGGWKSKTRIAQSLIAAGSSANVAGIRQGTQLQNTAMQLNSPAQQASVEASQAATSAQRADTALAPVREQLMSKRISMIDSSLKEPVKGLDSKTEITRLMQEKKRKKANLLQQEM